VTCNCVKRLKCGFALTIATFFFEKQYNNRSIAKAPINSKKKQKDSLNNSYEIPDPFALEKIIAETT
jgi:hypothetical protein